MNRWFRFYNEALDDPKVQMLRPELFKFWVNLLCLASRNEGVLPEGDAEIAFALRLDSQTVAGFINELTEKGLLDDGDQLRPHNWDARQYKSDVSTERVKRFREAKRNVSETAKATPPDTDTDTDNTHTARTREADFRQAVVTEYHRLGLQTPETGRAIAWLAHGWNPEICLSAIRDCLKRKGRFVPLSYFDNAIADAHAKPPDGKARAGPPVRQPRKAVRDIYASMQGLNDEPANQSQPVSPIGNSASTNRPRSGPVDLGGDERGGKWEGSGPRGVITIEAGTA